MCDLVINYCLGFFVHRGAQCEEEKEAQKENGKAYTIVKILLKMGNYLNKGYHVLM